MGMDGSNERGYFEQSAPPLVILLSFPLVTLPVAFMILANRYAELVWVYLWLFGMTHFVLTFVVYLQSATLTHFRSSTRNMMIYFAIPIVIFVLFDLVHTYDLKNRLPHAAYLFWGAVGLMNYNHLNRQSFGVHQLFKTRIGIKFPTWLKRTENNFYAVATGMIFLTFLSGGVAPILQEGTYSFALIPKPAEYETQTLLITQSVISLDILQVIFWMASVPLVGLFVISLSGLIRTSLRAGKTDGLTLAIFYFLLQGVAALMAIVSLPLLLPALAMHYVEYHVLMYPRCFHIPLDPTKRMDRLFATLRASRVLFYILLLAIAGLATIFVLTGMGGAFGRNQAVESGSEGYVAVIALFNGLFVFHYFVEIFIWRFGNPFYRQSLLSLYFRPRR